MNTKILGTTMGTIPTPKNVSIDKEEVLRIKITGKNAEIVKQAFDSQKPVEIAEKLIKLCKKVVNNEAAIKYLDETSNNK